MLTVGVVGARRARQGIGEYVAREFSQDGARVIGIVGTSEATVTEARQNLRASYGIDCEGFTSLPALLEAQDPDIIAICSPALCHFRHLQLALDAKKHVLCEKPLWWSEELTTAPPEACGIETVTRELCAGFDRQGRRLATITQWPYAAEAIFELFPELGDEQPESLAMRLGPRRGGTAMVIDSGSHLLSVLHDLVGAGEIGELRGEIRHEALDLHFDYHHSGGTLRVDFELRVCPEPPRPAEIGLNGRRMKRRIDVETYRMRFESGSRQVPIEDPLKQLVQEFIRCIEEDREPPTGRHLVARMRELHQLVAFTYKLEAAG